MTVTKGTSVCSYSINNSCFYGKYFQNCSTYQIVLHIPLEMYLFTALFLSLFDKNLRRSKGDITGWKFNVRVKYL